MFASKKKTQEPEAMTGQEDKPVEAQTTGEQPAPAEDAASEALDHLQTEPVPQPDPLEAELVACKDRYTRLLADFDNFRKRQVREREEIVKRANEALILELLPVIDHFDLALAAATDPADPFVAGIRMVSDQLHAALAKFDCQPDNAMGQPFNPDRHEALSEMPSDSTPAGHVAMQFRKGWSLAGRMIRPAQVMISSGAVTPAPAAEPQPEQPLNPEP